MKFSETLASKCRYAGAAEEVFKDADIIWEHSIAEPQGEVNILAQLPDGKLAYFCWNYGSDGSDDEWLLEGYTYEQIMEEMRQDAVYFDKEKEVKIFIEGFTKAYPDLPKKFQEWKYRDKK